MNRLFLLTLSLLFCFSCEKSTNQTNNSNPTDLIEDIDFSNVSSIIRRCYPFDDRTDGTITMFDRPKYKYIAEYSDGTVKAIDSSINVRLISKDIYVLFINGKNYIYDVARERKTLIEDRLLNAILTGNDNSGNGGNILQSDNKVIYINSDAREEPTYIYDIVSAEITEQKSPLINSDGICVYLDKDIIARIKYPTGKILRFEGDKLPSFVLKGDFYCSDQWVLYKVEIGENGLIDYSSINQDNPLPEPYFSVWNYTSNYDKVIIRSMGAGANNKCYSVFDGENITPINYLGLDNLFYNGYDLGERILGTIDSSVVSFDITTLKLKQIGTLPSQEKLNEMGIELKERFLSINGKIFHYIFRGSDYNTGETLYGTINSNGTVTLSPSQNDIYNLYYDKPINISCNYTNLIK